MYPKIPFIPCAGVSRRFNKQNPRGCSEFVLKQDFSWNTLYFAFLKNYPFVAGVFNKKRGA